jgi:hypothetical protein
MVKYVFILLTRVTHTIQKAKTDRFSVLNAAFKPRTFSNLGGQKLGTLAPRPQNPWAVRGEQFSAYLWAQADRSERSQFRRLRLKSGSKDADATMEKNCWQAGRETVPLH